MKRRRITGFSHPYADSRHRLSDENAISARARASPDHTLLLDKNNGTELQSPVDQVALGHHVDLVASRPFPVAT
jgi:hypothetical protein